MQRRKDNLRLLLALFLLVGIMSLLAPNFLTKGNLLDIIRLNSIKGMMSIAMTFVLLTGGIDLSVGSTFALSGAVTASLLVGSYSDYVTSNLVKCPVFAAIAAGLLAAGLLGLINGLVITKLKVEPFIATLAMMIFARGLTYLYTGGYPINFQPIPEGFAWLGKGYAGFLPAPAVLFAAVALGGTGMSGGSGGVAGTFLGVAFLAVLNNGLDMVNVPSFYQYLIKGAILVLAVYADKLLTKGKH